MVTTNYKGKTNEELAIEFLNSMVEKEAKTTKHFNILLTKHKAWNKEGVEDIVNETIEKVYLSILKNGFERGYFQAYFEESLKNNLLQHIIKSGKKDTLLTDYSSQLSTTTDDDDENEQLANYEQLAIDKMLFAFEQLAESSKETLNMLYDEYRYREIQRTLGLTIGQVKMRIRKARAQVLEYQRIYPHKTWERLEEIKGYSISRYGYIRNDITGKLLKSKENKNGIHTIQLEEMSFVVHELVYKYFGDEHDREGYIYHINGNTRNNSIDNLLFDTI